MARMPESGARLRLDPRREHNPVRATQTETPALVHSPQSAGAHGHNPPFGASERGAEHPSGAEPVRLGRGGAQSHTRYTSRHPLHRTMARMPKSVAELGTDYARGRLASRRDLDAGRGRTLGSPSPVRMS